jgi:hypothetical protein
MTASEAVSSVILCAVGAPSSARTVGESRQGCRSHGHESPRGVLAEASGAVWSVRRCKLKCLTQQDGVPTLTGFPSIDLLARTALTAAPADGRTFAPRRAAATFSKA